jgi:hypothetical protein
VVRGTWGGTRSSFPIEEEHVSGRMKIAIAGVVLGLILFFVNFWLGLVVILAAIAVPVGAYLMLDPSQRRRLRDINRRRQVGR